MAYAQQKKVLVLLGSARYNHLEVWEVM